VSAKPLYDNKENFEGWITDHNGVIRIATKTDGVTTSTTTAPRDKEPFAELHATGFKDSFSPMFFTFDNKNLYVSTTSTAATRARSWSGTWPARRRSKLIANKDYDVDGRGLQPQAQGAHHGHLDRRKERAHVPGQGDRGHVRSWEIRKFWLVMRILDLRRG
jgi:hypothetical protein